MQPELIAPIAKSPLDSARGRGRVRTKRCYTPSSQKLSFKEPSKVVLIIYTENKSIDK